MKIDLDKEIAKVIYKIIYNSLRYETGILLTK